MKLRRTIMLAVFAFTFMMAFSVCTYTAHAYVEIEKGGVILKTCTDVQEAVEEVNSNGNIKDGDNILFRIKGENATSGNAPALDKRINLEIAGTTLQQGNNETLNIINAGSVYIHDMDIKCHVLIEDSIYATNVRIEKVNTHRRLDISKVGTCTIDGTKEDGTKSMVQHLNINGITSQKIKMPKLKGIELKDFQDDSEVYPGYELNCVECDEMSDVNIENNQLILEYTRIKKLCNTDITYHRGVTKHGDTQYTALAMGDSLIDLMEDCMIVADFTNTSPYTINGRAFLAGSINIASPNNAVGTMRNCIIYGPHIGMELRNIKCSIDTIDSCVIVSKETAILNAAEGVFATAANIENVTGDTVIYNQLGTPVYFWGAWNIEAEKGAADADAVGSVRVGTASGQALFSGKAPTLPSGYSWKNTESSYNKKKTPDKLKAFNFDYDDAVFSYISYDKCRITYHEGAGTKKPGFDQYYQSEVVGGSYFTVKGFNSNYISGVDPAVVPKPMEWAKTPAGGVDCEFENTGLRATKKSYDFYPNYSYNSIYKVEFETGIGSKVETQQVFNANAPRKPGDPTHPGAVFDGWYLEESCTNKYDFNNSLVDKIDTGDRTVKLYAKWNLNDCKVTFNTLKNGGKPEDQTTVTVKWGNKVKKPAPDPVYSEGNDYKYFTGWYKTAKGTTEFDFANTVIKADTTIYACFEYNHSTVTINMDGGSVPDLNSPWVKNSAGNIVYRGLVDDQIAYPWDRNSRSDEPVKAYYKYDGLYQDSTFTKPIKFEERVFWVPPTTTYYVKFVPKNYDVKYYDVSYSEYKKDTSIAPIKEETLPYGSKVEYVPEEYTERFAGWNPYTYSYTTGFSHIDDWDGNVAGMEMRLFMKENPKIIFHSDIAGTRVMETAYVKAGTSLSGYADRKAEPADYNFVGWTTKPKTDGEYSYKETLPDSEKDEEDREEYPYVGFFDFSGSMPGEDINLYPVLVRDRLRVILDPKGGTMGDGDDGKPQSLSFTVDINEKLRMKGLNSATKDGYDLDGWYTQNGVKWNEDWGVTSEYCLKDEAGKAVRTEEPGKNYYYYTVGLNAVWKSQEVTIEYKGGEHGSTDAPAGSTALGNTVVLADAANPDYGYLFRGWKDSSGVMHSAGEVFLFDDWSLVADGKLVFTAQYEEKPVENRTITFDTAGGSYIEPITQAEGSSVAAPGAPVRAGYKFTGWNPAVPETMPAEDMTCTAQWEQVLVTIKFDSAGGSHVATIAKAEGTPLTKPDDPVKEHYKFTGWTPSFPDVMPAKDMMLSATWEPVIYKITFDANGGRFSGGKTQQIVSGIYDATVTAPDEPTRDKYEFSGWDMDVPAHIPGGDITIRATWTKTGPDDPEPKPEPKPAPKPAPAPAAPQVTEVSVNAVTADAAMISQAIQAAGGNVDTLVLGSDVKKISKGALAGTNIRTLVVTSKKLKKKSVKGSLKGSNVTTVRVSVGNAKTNKKYVKKYKKIFTKKNAGKKVSVKKI